MTESVNSSSTNDVGRWHVILLLIFIVGLCAVAFNSQSLWIDESYTALKAQQTTIPNWWIEMRRASGSDMQMPLYMLWIWACEKLFGSGEIALRAVNLFWVLPGLVALWHTLARQPRLRVAVFLVTVCNPFVWYYLNEARPYAMQIGASLFLAAALCHWSRESFCLADRETLWVWGFAVALVALSGASMLGMIWAGAAILAAIFLTPKERLLKLAREHVFAWLVALLLLTSLGFYYLWTLHAGARASDIASTDLKNVAFIGYELFGFAGLGPSRLEIRDGGLHVFKSYAPGLAVYAAVVLALVIFGVLAAWQNYPRKKFLGLAFIVAVPAIFILAAGFLMHFRVLGRHFAPLLAVVIFILGLGVSSAWRRSAIWKILVVAFFVLSLASGLSLRLATRHAKDDYRSAAGLARTALAAGKTVWWSADLNAAGYYQLPVTTNSVVVGQAISMINPATADLATVAVPDFVFISRPDIYDPRGVVADYLDQNHFQKTAVLPAFVVWEKPGNQAK
jgi:hypothetical protein